jgi:hypothetical protein
VAYTLWELAHAYAQSGEPEKALNCISEARAIFPDTTDLPTYAASDTTIFSLISYEGQVHLDLGSDEVHPLRSQNQYKKAGDALAQIDHLLAQLLVPERIRVEMVDQQAQAVLGVGDLGLLHTYLIQGAQGAQALQSEKRRQEVLSVWKAARKVWPRETRVLELADLLL